MQKQTQGSCSHKLASSLKGIDRFGSQITLTLNKKNNFNTCFGGVLSILAWMGALAYFAYCLHRVNQNEYQMASINGYKGNVFDYTHNLTGHFDPAFILQYVGPNMDVYANMDTYFTMYVQQMNQHTDPYTGASSWTLQYEYNMMKCNIERFGSDLQEDAKFLGLANFWCMNGTDLTITNKQTSFSIIFDYCNQTFLDRMYPGQGKICKTIDQITPELSKSTLYRYYKTSYLDFNEFAKNPVKSYFKNNAYSIIPNKTQQNSAYVTRHSAELQDNKFSGYATPKHQEFYDFDQIKLELKFDYDPYNKQSHYYPNGIALIQFNFELNAFYTLNQRRVFTVLDAVSQTGGIAGVLIGLFSIINSLFQSTLFKLQLMRQLYTKQKKSNSTKAKQVNQFNFQNQESSSQNNNTKDSQITQQTLISQMIFKISQLKPFELKTSRLIWHEIKKKVCFCKRNIVSKKLTQFKQAEEKLNQELDLLIILKKLRRVDFLTKMLVDANHIQLIKYAEDSSYHAKMDTEIKKENTDANAVSKQLKELIKDSKKSANAKRFFKILSLELNDQQQTNAQQNISSIQNLSFKKERLKKRIQIQDEEEQILTQKTKESPQKSKQKYKALKKTKDSFISLEQSSSNDQVKNLKKQLA
eukprot:403350168